ncbi:MAG: DAK2 domain-containing protein [Acidimicrobiales bacterium]
MTSLDQLEPKDLKAVLVGYRDALRAHQERLNRLNVYPVPDGDTGTNMALTLESVVTDLGPVDVDGKEAMADVCRAIGHASLMGARGNSGVILSQILRGFTDTLKGCPTADGRAVAEALAAASTAAYQAVMRPVEGTILTVVREAAEAAQAVSEPDVTLVRILDAAASAGRGALERTPDLLPVLAEAGVVDAGGAGFLLLLDVLLFVADERPVPAPDPSTPLRGPLGPSEMEGPPVAQKVSKDAAEDALRYEVMFLLEAPDEAVAAFKQAWAALGDSIVVVGGDGLWNCHIHTDDIGASIDAAVDMGRPRQIRVTDLAEQVAEERWVREGAGGDGSTPPQGDAPPPPARPSEATAVVAVGAGEGALTILHSLGVETVVSGGQSMNPSTAELLEAIEASGARGVVLLPNNKNVVPVAQRAAEMAGKPVLVVPTQSLAEGFAALMGFDPKADAETNAETMAEAADQVRWGEVTWAVRDATTAAGPVREGDHLGVLGHEIVTVAAGLADAACALLERLVEDGDELVTVVEGEAATSEATGRVTEWLAAKRPKAAVEVHRGDQPLSAYLFSAE